MIVIKLQLDPSLVKWQSTVCVATVSWVIQLSEIVWWQSHSSSSSSATMFRSRLAPLVVCELLFNLHHVVTLLSHVQIFDLKRNGEFRIFKTQMLSPLASVLLARTINYIWKTGWHVSTRTVMISDSHYRIILTKRIYDNYITVIIIEN